MRVPTPAELLTLWERGHGQPPARQALGLLALAYPDLAHEELASLPVGRRDACLLLLRERLFGATLASLAACPRCAEPLDLSFGVAEIWAQPEEEPQAEYALVVDGYEVRFRLPNSLDLLAAAASADVLQVRAQILRRCVLGVTRDGAEVELDLALLAAPVAAELARLDPQADIQLALACPACDQRWQAQLDIVSFLWQELDAWARRTLADVHALASAYGWREADVLELSPFRRQYYLELVMG